MLDRIRQLLADRQLSSTQFADVIGVSRPVISHILSGRNKPSLEVVQKIMAAFPDVAPAWLLTGSGPMKADEPAAIPAPAKRRPTPPAPEPAPEAPAEPVSAPAPILPRAAAPEEAVGAPVAAGAPISSPSLTAPEPAAALAAPVVAPVAPVAAVAPQPAPPTPAGADWAQALAEPGKAIRRIVIFYQDGTFTDYQPEAPARH